VEPPARVRGTKDGPGILFFRERATDPRGLVYEALSAFRDDPYAFDAIISDQFLDGAVRGTTLSREFLKLRSDVLIVLFTGHAESIREEAMSLGIHWLIHKPVSFDELIHVVKGALGIRPLS
jgi:DNA-binding NtrC family response regulator